MANPQPKPFIQLSAELQMAIARFGFYGNERRVLDAVIAYTYGGLEPEGKRGMNRKHQTLSYAQLAWYCGLPRQEARRVALRLVKMKVLRRWQTVKKSYTWAIQKDYEKWKRGEASSPPLMGAPMPQGVCTHADKGEASSPPPYSEASSPPPHKVTDNASNDNSTPKGVCMDAPLTDIQTFRHTDNAADRKSGPKSWSELDRSEQENLLPLTRRYEAVPGFKIYAWITKALQGKCGNQGRRFSPAAIKRVLETVTPEGPADNLYAVLNTYLNSTQETLEHEERKRQARDGAQAIDVSGLVKRMD